MRKTKRFRSVFTLMATCALGLSSAFFAWNHKSASAESQPQSTSNVLHIGDVIEADDYTISGVKADKIQVEYPSGSVFGGEKFTVEAAGRYAITYFATVGGERVTKTENYLAVRRPQDVVIADEGMSVDYGKYYVESPYTIQKDVYGAIATFKAGQTIGFAANVKTEKLTADYNIIDMIVMPSVFKETDFERLTVRVADAEDKENFVEIIIDSSNAVDGSGMVSYVRAGANGQQYGGYEGSTYHTAHYGTQVEHSFRAMAFKYNDKVNWEDPRNNPKNQAVSEHSLTIAIDNEERKIFCGPTSTESTDNQLVNDLDDAAHYKGNPWGGFTSDEVTVTVTASAFSKVEGKVLIKSFGDYDFSKEIEDSLAPEIFIEYDKTQKLPIAEVGKDFPLFPFTARDALDKDVLSSVWVYYKDAQGRKITVANDGDSFFVKYAGTYEIVYHVEDYTGNVAEERIEIEAINGKPNIFIAIDSSLIEADVYETVDIPTVEEMQAFGGSGALKIERAVCDPAGKPLDVKDKLTLAKLGDYKVVFTVTDYLGNVEYGVITIRSTVISAPKFVELPVFDARLIKGFVYDLPEVLAVETVDGKIVELACKTYVNGELVTGSFEADGETMEIKYVAEGETGMAEWPATLTVIDTDYGTYKDRYFYSENDVTFTMEKSYLNLSFAEDSAVNFINALYSRGFSMAMSYTSTDIFFTSMAITLTDAENRGNTVTVRLYYDKAGDAWFVQLQDGKKMTYVTSKGILPFEIAGNGGKIVDASGETVANVVSYDNGEPFTGFSDLLYVRIAFEGVTAQTNIQIAKIANQSLGHNKNNPDPSRWEEEDVEPIIVLDEPFALRQRLGTKAKIPTAKAFDVLGQIAEFTVTVKLGGQVLASGDATKPLDLMLDKDGYYMVSYYAKDSNGNGYEIPYVLFVKDETAPTLSVGSLNSEYKQGDKIKIPSYSATDNGANCTVQVMLILPNNEMRLLHYVENGKKTSLLSKENDLYNSDFKADEDTFVALQKGKYVLRVMAADEYYNYTVKEIEFIVK